MNEIESKAKELVDIISEQISEAREELAKKMVDAGMLPNMYNIADNLDIVIDNPSIHYKCWPVLKEPPRMIRGENK